MILLTRGAFRGHDERAFHFFVVAAAVFRADDGIFPWRRRDEVNGDLLAAARHFLVHLDLLDLEAVDAVVRGDDEADVLALGDFDARGLKAETLRHDRDFSWLAVITRLRGLALSESSRSSASRTRVEGRRSRGGVLLVRHCCRPQQERRPRR